MLAPPLQAQEDAPAPSACPVRPQYPLPTGPAALQRLLETLDASASACLRHAPFHAWRGAILLAQGAHADAIEALERALLLDPDLPGTQLDYAQALTAMGDTASATGLLRQLQARTDLPTYLRPLLDSGLAQLDPPPAWLHRWTLSSALGADSNLNNAPAASQLTLTFPQGAVTLPLLQSYRPQSGGAWLGSVQWQGLRPAGDQLWLATAELRTRATADTADTGFAQGDFSVAWLQAPAAPAQWIGRAAFSRMDFGGQHLLDGLRISALRQWRLPLCRTGLGWEAEQRHYPTSPALDGSYTGALTTLQCGSADSPWPVGTAGQGVLSHQQWGLQMRAGQDLARHGDRPGGHYRRVELRINWEARAGETQLAAEYGFIRQNDSAGYSPLLDNNLKRHTRRQSVRFMLSHPLPAAVWGSAEAFMAWEINAQGSNIEAFASRQRAISAGLRWQLR